VQPPLNREAGATATGGFFRSSSSSFSEAFIYFGALLYFETRKENQIKTSSLLSENASEETKQALNEVDKNLDDIYDVLVL
jgi:hypothetical protein